MRMCSRDPGRNAQRWRAGQGSLEVRGFSCLKGETRSVTHCNRKMVTSGAENTFSSHPGVAGEVDQEAWKPCVLEKGRARKEVR